MSPMCADSQASRPSARQKVFLRSPPTASDGRRVEGQAERQRRVAPRAAYRRLAAADRTVTESSQGTWIGRSWVSQASARPASRAQRLVVVGDDRLAGQVAARHHQQPRSRRVAGQPEQQVVERACRRASRRGRPGRAPPRGAATAPGRRARPGRSGARARSAGPPRRRRASTRPRAVARSRDHHRERLVAALLALAQRRDRVLVGRVAGEVVAADALHRDDRAVGEQAARLGERVLAVRRAPRCGADEPQPRPAVGAADRSARGSGGRPGRRTPRRTPRTSGTAAIVVAGRS